MFIYANIEGKDNNDSVKSDHKNKLRHFISIERSCFRLHTMLVAKEKACLEMHVNLTKPKKQCPQIHQRKENQTNAILRPTRKITPFFFLCEPTFIIFFH